MLQLDLEVMAFWTPLLAQVALMVPALAGSLRRWRPSRALLAVLLQILLLTSFFLASTIPCIENDCQAYRESHKFTGVQLLHLALSYSLLLLSLSWLKRSH